MNFHSLEHKLIKSFKNDYGLEKRDYVLFCSGGLDSTVLLNILNNINSVFKYTLKVVYVHHGSSESKKTQSNYRDQAEVFVRKMCEDHSLSFEVEKAKTFLKSENECRDFRIEKYQKYISQGSRVFLAHHQDDFFETLVLRLIRGTGPEGFVEPFSTVYERPLLKLCSKKELCDYAFEKNIASFDDPSNEDQDHLRNWLRKSLFKSIEECPHGLAPFKRSLMNLSDHVSQVGSSFKQNIHFREKNTGFFELVDFLHLNQVQKKAFVSHILYQTKKSGYTTGQVLEVVKLLENKELEMEFTVSSIKWTRSQTNVYFEMA